MKSKTMTLAMHCSCGVSLVGKLNSPELADGVLQLFSQKHSGIGHAPIYRTCKPAHQRNGQLRLQRA